MTAVLVVVLVVFAVGAGVVVVDAVRDLVAAPSFAGLLRLVVEAVAALVVSLLLWRRVALRGPPRGR